MTDPAICAVRLRSVTAADLDLLEAWRSDPEHESEYGDFLPMHRRSPSRRERWEEDGLLAEDSGVLIVCCDDEPVGELQWHAVRYGPNEGSKALNIGIALTPTVRGRGVGSRAQAAAARFLFAHTTTHRVEASTDVSNVAEQRALEKAGFTREGVLRGAQFRRGQWRDMVLFARLRTDPDVTT